MRIREKPSFPLAFFFVLCNQENCKPACAAAVNPDKDLFAHTCNLKVKPQKIFLRFLRLQEAAD